MEKTNELAVHEAGLGIRFNFLRNWIKQFFWVQIRIQLLKKCGFGSSLTKFVKKINSCKVFYSCKKHKRLLKNKKQWSFVQIYRYFKKLKKIAVISNFLAFFLFLFKQFLLLDPDIECGSGSRSWNECGSGSTALARSYNLIFWHRTSKQRHLCILAVFFLSKRMHTSKNLVIWPACQGLTRSSEELTSEGDLRSSGGSWIAPRA